MLKKYPFVKQDGLKDCGCACLLMILNYYKGNIPIERIRELSKMNRNGTSAYNLINCANEIGFSSKGIECDIEHLKEVILPCIAHVIIDNKYKHYIVIYNIDYKKEKITIADPDKGIKKISFEQFNKIWSGVLIILYPCRSLPFVKNTNISQFIYSNIIKYKKELIILFLLSLLIIILKLLSSFYFKFLVDGIELSKNYLKSIFILFLVFEITRIIIDYLRNKFLINLNCKIDFCLTTDAFKRIISLPYIYYHNRTSGEIVSKINDLSNVRNIISKVIVSLFIDIPLLIISIIFLIKINVYLFFIVFLVFTLYLLLTLVYRHIYCKYIENIKNKKEVINSYMFENINGFETVKGINIENDVISKFNYKYVLLLNKIFRLEGHINNQSFIKDLLNNIGNLFILFLGSLMVYDGKFELGYLITFSSMVSYFLEPIRNIIDMDVDFKEGKDSINRMLSLYEDNTDNGIVNFNNGNIVFKNLTFAFDNNIILNNINLEIKAGEKIMLCGKSGSGKSTLFKLLMKYYDTKRGCISISNKDINDINVNSIREHITYVSQNEVLFNGTIIDNLKYHNCDNEEILNITKILEFNEILNNDLGLNYLIEENGFNLSGGQRQRIVLARAFLKNSDIVLIDEGLSQIDVELERKILKNLFLKYKEKTIIIISHRLENLDLYDRTFKMSNGVISEDINYG